MPQDVRKFVDVYSIDMEEAGYMVLCSKIKHHLRPQFLLVAMLSARRPSTPTPSLGFFRTFGNMHVPAVWSLHYGEVPRNPKYWKSSFVRWVQDSRLGT